MGTSVIDISELLQEIVKTLYDDRPALLAATQVNQSWARPSTNVLWRAPPLEALVALTIDRRQYYARKIRHLVFESEQGKNHAVFRQLELSGLKTVTIDSYYPRVEEELQLEQYLQPCLEEFQFYGGPTKGLMSKIMRPCLRLVVLTLDYRDDGRTEAELLQLLERQHHLRTIDFGTQMNELLTVLVFAELSALNTLRDMSLTRNSFLWM
jgi:hypothetical protein